MAPLNRRLAAPLVAGAVAVALPVWLLAGTVTPAPPPVEVPPLAAPAVLPPLRAAFARLLFAAPAAAEQPADAPQLIGVVGRLGRDAVAMVRGADGTRTLAPGDAIDGWQLRSLSGDAAYFTRGAQGVRVVVPLNDS